MMAGNGEDDIHLLAAMWAARMDRGVLSELDQILLDNWLIDNSRRLGALARAQANLVPRTVIDEPSSETPEAGSARYPQAFARRRLLQAGGALAALAAGLATFALLPEKELQTFRTNPGEVHMLPLEDGSVITLNTDSAISIDFSSDQRTIHLLHGEALFDVAKDPNRPFKVLAGTANVTAIGTSFTVRRMADRRDSPVVKVEVQSGIVEMAAPTGEKQSQRIGANMRATTGLNGEIVAQPISIEELNRDLAWREGKIAFSGTSLREAVTEFNRYNPLKLEIHDETIAGRTMTGLFSATNPKGFATAVAIGLEVEFYETPQRIVFVGKASELAKSSAHAPSVIDN